MASLEVTRTRISMATGRVKAAIERLVGEPITFQTSKDPEVARAFFLEQLADRLESLALVDDEGGDEGERGGASLRDRLSAALADRGDQGFYELAVDEGGDVVGVRRFKSKRGGNPAEVIL